MKGKALYESTKQNLLTQRVSSEDGKKNKERNQENKDQTQMVQKVKSSDSDSSEDGKKKQRKNQRRQKWAQIVQKVNLQTQIVRK